MTDETETAPAPYDPVLSGRDPTVAEFEALLVSQDGLAAIRAIEELRPPGLDKRLEAQRQYAAAQAKEAEAQSQRDKMAIHERALRENPAYREAWQAKQAGEMIVKHFNQLKPREMADLAARAGGLPGGSPHQLKHVEGLLADLVPFREGRDPEWARFQANGQDVRFREGSQREGFSTR